MSRFYGVHQSLRRRIFQINTNNHCTYRTFEIPNGVNFSLARFASQSNGPPSATQGSSSKQPSRRRGIESGSRERQLESSRKASLLLNRLSKKDKKTTATKASEPVVKDIDTPLATTKASQSESKDDDAPRTIEIDEQEVNIQDQIVKNRTKLFWPGIWTFFALTGTYSACAYLDARYNDNALSGETQLAERAVLPQTWFLTPEVIKQGIKAGWNELDNLTIGIVVLCAGVQLLKKSPLPLWEKLIHITGEKKYTALTYPFVHGNWSHMGMNMFVLSWFLPGVVRHLDGDVFHAAALYLSVPLLTSYLQHFTFRWFSTNGLPLNMGASGAIAAILGAFCMAYPDEKVWLPPFLVFRLDAMYCGLLFAVWQLAATVQTPKGGNRPAYLVHVVSLGLGAAYVYFDGKDKIWKPLVERFRKAEKPADVSTSSQS